MAYKLLWEIRAQEDLKHLDPVITRRIVSKVASHLVKDPVNLSAPLKGNLAGLHKYRTGDYRVIIAIDLPGQVIRVLRVGHRKDIYK